MLFVFLHIIRCFLKIVNLVSNLDPVVRLKLQARDRIGFNIPSFETIFNQYKLRDYIEIMNIIFTLQNPSQNGIDIKNEYLYIEKTIKDNLIKNLELWKIKQPGELRGEKLKNLFSNYKNQSFKNTYSTFDDEDTNDFILYILNKQFENDFRIDLYIDSNNTIFMKYKIPKYSTEDIVRTFTYDQLRRNLAKMKLLLQEPNNNIIVKDERYYNSIMTFYLNYYTELVCKNFILHIENNELKIKILIESLDGYIDYNYDKILKKINTYKSSYLFEIIKFFTIDKSVFEPNKNKSTIQRTDFLKHILYNYPQQETYPNMYDFFIKNNEQLKFAAIGLNFNLDDMCFSFNFLNMISYSFEEFEKIISFEIRLINERYISNINYSQHRKLFQTALIFAGETGLKQRNALRSVVIDKILGQVGHMELKGGSKENNFKSYIVDKLLVKVLKDLNTSFINNFIFKNSYENILNTLQLSYDDINTPITIASHEQRVYIDKIKDEFIKSNLKLNNINKVKINFTLKKTSNINVENKFYLQCYELTQINLLDTFKYNFQQKIKELIKYNII